MSSDITFETFQFCKPHYDVEEFGCAMGRVAGLVSEQSDITFDIVEFGCPMGSVAASVTSSMGFSFGWIHRRNGAQNLTLLNKSFNVIK